MDIKEYILSHLRGSVNSSNNLNCRCPFHNDSSPSFSISLDNGLFICRSASCGVKGNFAKFFKLTEGISWSEVRSRLKTHNYELDINDLLDQKLPQEKKVRFNPFPPPEFYEDLNVIEYLASRGLGREIIDVFGLKYGKIGHFEGIDISKTILVPVFDLDGTYKTFQVRKTSKAVLKTKKTNNPRWFNPSESPVQDLLYGGWMSFNEGYLFIVEGASDVWNMYKNGQQSVGLFTKEASHAQFNRLSTLLEYYNLTPVVCLDGDAKEYSNSLFLDLTASGFSTKIVLLDDDRDPGSLSMEEIVRITQELDNESG
jgi:DNA primase